MAKFTAGKTIVDLAAATPDLPTLVTALKAGKLVDTLSGAGPFTVFAPTNEAFARIPKATLDHLLDPKDIRELGDVITYHAASDSAVLFVVVVCLEGHRCYSIDGTRALTPPTARLNQHSLRPGRGCCISPYPSPADAVLCWLLCIIVVACAAVCLLLIQ